MQQEKFSLKDHLFNAEKVAFLSDAIAKVYSSFEKEIIEAFPQLELKERTSSYSIVVLESGLCSQYTKLN